MNQSLPNRLARRAQVVCVATLAIGFLAGLSKPIIPEFEVGTISYWDVKNAAICVTNEPTDIPEGALFARLSQRARVYEILGWQADCMRSLGVPEGLSPVQAQRLARENALKAEQEP